MASISDIRSRQLTLGGAGSGASSSTGSTAVQTAADTNVTVNPSTSYAYLTSQTATRTFTLPAANAVPAGKAVVISDVGGFIVSGSLFITVVPAGADTLNNSRIPRVTTTCRIGNTFGSLTFISDGTSKWIMMNNNRSDGFYLLSTNNSLNIPDSTWTPIYFITAALDVSGSVTIPTASTTIAAGSNGNVLPQNTINVASTTGFTSTGHAAVTIGGVDTIFGYTGTSGGNSFTGCNAGVNAGISTGTLATSQAVKQVFCQYAPKGMGIPAQIGEVAWASSSTGYRGLRIRGVDGVLNLPINVEHRPGIAVATWHQQVMSQNTSQGAAAPTVFYRLEAFQNSGAALAVVNDVLAAPQWLSYNVSEG